MKMPGIGNESGAGGVTGQELGKAWERREQWHGKVEDLLSLPLPPVTLLSPLLTSERRYMGEKEPFLSRPYSLTSLPSLPRS